MQSHNKISIRGIRECYQHFPENLTLSCNLEENNKCKSSIKKYDR